MAENNNIEIIVNSLTSDLGENSNNNTASSNNNDSDWPVYNKSDSDGDMSVTTDTYITHSVSGSAAEMMPSKSFVNRKKEKDIFNKARQYLNPGPVFRFFVYLYAERKLLTFFWVHCIATLVVWGESNSSSIYHQKCTYSI